MLHRVKIPTYGNALQELLDFQLQLLTFASTPAQSYPLTWEAVQRAFPGANGEGFAKKLWISKSKPTKLHGKLNALVEHIACHSSSTLGAEILNAYEHDIEFHRYFNDPGYHFHYPLLAEETRKRLKELLVDCYDWLYDGVPFSGKAEEKFTHQTLLKVFHQENRKTLDVCPMCDGQPPIRTKERDYAHVDHFFPQSLYPFLSIHPYNLIPICITCNTAFKRDIDPILGKLLSHTFHSYGRPAVDDVTIEVVDGYKIVLEDVVARQKSEPPVRLDNFRDLFRLHTLWQDNYLMRVKETVVEHLRGIGSYRKDNGYPLDANDVRRELEILLQKQSSKVGKRMYYLMERSYACYALGNDEELRELVGEMVGA